MSLKFEEYLYRKVKENADYIGEIANTLSTVKSLDIQNVLKPTSISDSYESRKLRDIKNALANIYLILELHDIECFAEEVFNKDYQPK